MAWCIRLIAAIQLTENQRQCIPAQSASGTHNTCHQANLIAETLGNQLEHGAISGSQTHHTEEQHDYYHRKRWHEGYSDQHDAGSCVQESQHAGSANFVCQVTPDRPEETACDYTEGGNVSGTNWREPILGVEEDGEIVT